MLRSLAPLELALIFYRIAILPPKYAKGKNATQVTAATQIGYG
jgi:hypothetical protein